MPLPAPGVAWPPKEHDDIHREIATFDAWYTGDRDQLAAVYGGHLDGDHPFFHEHAAQYRGGVVGRVARFFWGEPRRPEQRAAKLHVPVASDIASVSSALLFSEPPTLTVEDATTQERLGELFDEHMWATLANGAELEAGLGGVYLRVGWDVDVTDRPIVTAIGPDLAVPVFRFGRLREVTFTWTLATHEPGVVVRHLEHHEPGRITHGLYFGDHQSLGRQMPLTDHPDTEILAGGVNEDGAVLTGLDGLDVVFVPGLPNRRWRKHRIGAHLGQPDIAGVEPLMDALDEAWTSWMRDIRLGKARAVVPQNYLITSGPGTGGWFDLDRELFVGLNALGNGDEMPLHVVQPEIRHEQHAATCAALLERCVSDAGYSAQTFGLTGEVAMTATESNARERKTNYTRGAKTRRWAPALAELAELLLAAYVAAFGAKATPARPAVEFPPTVRDGLETKARSAQMLRDAESASTPTRVRVIHPEWDDTEVQAEVDLIEGELKAAMPAPLADPGDDPTEPPDDEDDES